MQCTKGLFLWQANTSLKRTNLELYLDSHIKENTKDYQEQINNWYKLYNYSIDKGLFSYI